MTETLCEVRLDIALPKGEMPKGEMPNAQMTRRFEASWRKTLAASKMTGLVTPPAAVVSVRFRVCDDTFLGEHPSPFSSYLIARLSALPGGPRVISEPTSISPDWRGVKVWLSVPASDFPALLRPVKKPFSSKSLFFRGQRP